MILKTSGYRKRRGGGREEKKQILYGRSVHETHRNTSGGVKGTEKSFLKEAKFFLSLCRKGQRHWGMAAGYRIGSGFPF